MKNQELNQHQLTMKVLQTLILISGVLALLGKKTIKKNRVKRSSVTKVDFGLSASIFRNMNPEIVKKASSGIYLTEDFINLSLKPMIKEIVERLKKLENEDTKMKNTFEKEDKMLKNNLEGKNTALNYTLMAISCLGPMTLIIITGLLITLEKKLEKQKRRIADLQIPDNTNNE